jgi:hypothetical protein
VLCGLVLRAVLLVVPIGTIACSTGEPAEAPAISLPSGEGTSGETTDVSALEAPAPLGRGILVVQVRDDAGNAVPARLTFTGINGTRTPAFTRADIGVQQQGGILAFDRAFIVGDATLVVPTGSYEVWFSHGPEWEAFPRTVHIGPSSMTSVQVTLRHVVDTPGWISGDFHVHAEHSFDSKVPMRHRVYQFVADGVDLIVATDHGVISDYAPVIAKLGQTQRLASMQGDEVTTRDWGHFGAFPLAGDDAAPKRGAVVTKERTPESLFAELRARWPAAVIDVHHPRLDKGRMGYFHLGELDTKTLKSHRDGFSFDFDAVEVLNGFQDPDRASVDAVLADWFAFLRRGHRITATGNSDTHHLTFNLGGYPRNYVQLADDRPDQLDASALTNAIKRGQSYFTTGPILDVSVDGKGLGETVVPEGRLLELHVRVRAPAWIDVSRISVLVDGVKVLERRAAKTTPVRFVIVRVDGDRTMAPVIGDGVRFKVYPLAITNPIWVDVDGDGVVAPSIVD